jgi:membrane protein implicated in regulation of membrane protease activity
MKGSHIIVILIIFAWPLYYLYDRQLGAVSFLLLAIFFLSITIKEMRKLKREKSESQNKD